MCIGQTNRQKIEKIPNDGHLALPDSGAKTHNDERCIVELVFAVEVDTAVYQLLASSQVSTPAGGEELVKIIAQVEGMFVPQDAALDELVIVLQLRLELVFPKHHLYSTRSIFTSQEERKISEAERDRQREREREAK